MVLSSVHFECDEVATEGGLRLLAAAGTLVNLVFGGREGYAETAQTDLLDRQVASLCPAACFAARGRPIAHAQGRMMG